MTCGVVAFAAALTATVTFGATSVAAASGVTIAGPAQAGYWDTVRLTGTAPPSSDVAVYVRRAGASSYTPLVTVTADASGEYQTTYTERSDTSYYAVVDGVKSSVAATKVVTASCSVSGAVFRTLPVPTYGDAAPWPAAAAFTATANGLWAGYAESSKPGSLTGQFAVIAWRSGHPLRVLDRFRYEGVSYRLADTLASVAVVGVHDGEVVAAVQDPRYQWERQRYRGYVWSKGHRYRLRGRSDWTSVHPVGVSASGEIAGWARHGSRNRGTYYVVTWANPTAPPRVVVPGAWYPSIDAAGDITYNKGPGEYARLATGETVQLLGYRGEAQAFVDTAGGLRAYGRIWAPIDRRGDSAATAAWWDLDNLARARGVAPAVQRARPGLTIDAASSRGDLTLVPDTYPFLPRYLRTAAGALVRLPAQLGVDGGNWPSGSAFNRHGTLAYTAKRDGRIHFLRCSPA